MPAELNNTAVEGMDMQRLRRTLEQGARLLLALLILLTVLESSAARGQAPTTDPSVRLRQVLPADVATRLLALIAKARSRDLPGDALENRALKFAAKGVDPHSIERALLDQEARMEVVRDTLQRTRGRKPDGDEIEAGAEAMRKGVDGAKVGALARGAPSGRSLAVPLYVVGSLMDRGFPLDSAFNRVIERLRSRASDHDLETLATETAAQAMGRGKPAEHGREIGETKNAGRGAGAGNGNAAGGPPAGVPANGGAKVNPGRGKKPAVPPGKKP
jgi:hypothetical protein